MSYWSASNNRAWSDCTDMQVGLVLYWWKRLIIFGSHRIRVKQRVGNRMYQIVALFAIYIFLVCLAKFISVSLIINNHASYLTKGLSIFCSQKKNKCITKYCIWNLIILKGNISKVQIISIKVSKCFNHIFFIMKIVWHSEKNRYVAFIAFPAWLPGWFTWLYTFAC